MTWIALGLAALVGYYLFHNFETVNGVRHFTKHGREKALAALAKANIQISTMAVPGAAAFQLVAPVPGGVSGLEAVNTAESTGGVVICSESVLDIETSAVPVTALLFVAGDTGSANSIARPGTSFAVLSFV
jgi:hypothetical protein